MNWLPACASALLAALTVMAYAADQGTLVVLNKSDHTASLIDLASQQSRATLPTGRFPHEVAMSPDGKRAVIANYGNASEPGSSLTVLDVANRRVVKTIDLQAYRRPHGIVWLKGDEVLVTAEGSGVVLRVDVAAGEVRKAIATDQAISHMVAVAPRAQRAFVANIGSGSVTVIDLRTDRRIENIATGAGAEGIDVAPDEREVWVTNGRADSVSVIDVAALKVVATLPAQQRPIRAKFTSDGRHVLVSNAVSGDVTVFDAARRVEVKRIPMSSLARTSGERGPVPVGVLLSPALRFAYVANTNADTITVIDLADWRIVDRLRAGREPDGLGYSPSVLQ